MALVPGVFQQIPTISNGAIYGAGDCIGGIQKLSIAGQGRNQARLQSVVVQDQSNQKAPLTLLFFSADPTAITVNPATVADNMPFAWGTGGATGTFLGKVDVAAGDYETIGGQAIATKAGLLLPMQVAAPGGGVSGGPVPSLYIAVVTTGTPTYGSVSALTFELGFDALSW